MTQATIKRNFQKVISAIRNEETWNFPKAMMTKQQMEKATATVNCGGEWSTPEKTMARAKRVASDPRFLVFLLESNANAKIELNAFGTYQIRISFKDFPKN